MVTGLKSMTYNFSIISIPNADQSSIYALNENFGSASDLKALSKAVHDRNMVRTTSKPCSVQS